MKSLRTLLASIITILLTFLVGCGGNSPTPQVKAAIKIAFTSAPPASISEAARQSLSATVNNDTGAAGVDWTVTCGSADCGGFTSTATSSGTATTYTAPATIPTGGSVNVKATAKADASKNVSATIQITKSQFSDGTYVFSLAGQDQSSFFVYYVAGAFTVSNGVITAGEQDWIDYNAGNFTDQIASGTVTPTADGNLQIVLNTGNLNIGVAGVETINAAVVSGARGLINQFDGSATSSGTLDLQTTTQASLGGYAFFVSGSDVNGFPAA